MNNLMIKKSPAKLIAGCMITGLILGTIATIEVQYFFDNYQLRSPFQSPIVRREHSPIPVNEEIKEKHSTGEKNITPTPKKTVKNKMSLVNASKYHAFIDHIWFRESGRGTNPGGLAGACASQGKSNEFGFYPAGHWCFDSFEDGVKRLERWYDEHSELSDNQKLCYYNEGEKKEDCAYLGNNFAAMN